VIGDNIVQKLRIVALMLGVIVIASACSSDSSETTTTTTAAAAETTTTAAAAETTTTAAAATTTAAAAETTTTAAAVDLPDVGTIQVGTIPILGSAPFFVAAAKGYFTEQGLDVELQSFPSAGPMVAPLGVGQLDVGGGQFGVSYLNAVEAEIDVMSQASLSSQPPGFGAVPLLVRKELADSGEVTEVADLAGRKVAVNVERGTAEYLLAKALEPAGLTVDDVEMVTLPFPDMPAAFANGAIDAAILGNPLASKAVGEEVAVVLIEGDQITDTPQNGMVYFGQRFLDPDNSEAAVRFTVAYLQGVRDLQGEGWRSDENAAILSEATGVPVPAIQNGQPFFFDPNGEPNTASLLDIQQYHFDRGYTDLAAPLPISALFHREILDEALARIGLYED
jgi:NitT/TauT family transport system substrate-binding protein